MPICQSRQKLSLILRHTFSERMKIFSLLRSRLSFRTYLRARFFSLSFISIILPRFFLQKCYWKNDVSSLFSLSILTLRMTRLFTTFLRATIMFTKIKFRLMQLLCQSKSSSSVLLHVSWEKFSLSLRKTISRFEWENFTLTKVALQERCWFSLSSSWVLALWDYWKTRIHLSQILRGSKSIFLTISIREKCFSLSFEELRCVAVFWE